METKWPSIVGHKHTFIKGGEGSGNFGHAGRPGEVGGSGGGGGGLSTSGKNLGKMKLNDLRDYGDKLTKLKERMNAAARDFGGTSRKDPNYRKLVREIDDVNTELTHRGYGWL